MFIPKVVATFVHEVPALEVSPHLERFFYVQCIVIARKGFQKNDT